MTYGAFGLVEVLGSCNAILIADQMLKTSDVEFRTWNTKCGGHVTVFFSGDVSAVTAAVESVRENSSMRNYCVCSNFQSFRRGSSSCR